jgi:hypothetical protein
MHVRARQLIENRCKPCVASNHFAKAKSERQTVNRAYSAPLSRCNQRDMKGMKDLNGKSASGGIEGLHQHTLRK